LDTVQKIWAPHRKVFAPPGVPSWLRAWCPPTLHQFTILLSGISVSFSQLTCSGNKLQTTSSIDWWHNNDHYASLTFPFSKFGMLNLDIFNC